MESGRNLESDRNREGQTFKPAEKEEVPESGIEQGITLDTRASFAGRGRNILLINDLPGYGKVALAAMTPILSRLGHYIFQLPTAVVSNTLDYGKFRIQDMTEFMKDTLVVWEELGFEPDCICTGFILSEEQADLIGGYIQCLRQERKVRPLIVVDPIMADGGKLYNGIGPERVAAMRRLLVHADVMVPNMTEASFLTGIRPGQETGTDQEIRELVEGLRKISGKSVVITSVEKWQCRKERERKRLVCGAAKIPERTVWEKGKAKIPERTVWENGKAEIQESIANGMSEAETPGEEIHLVCGYDHLRDEYFEIPYDFLPVRVAGSGDIFSAVLTGELLKGNKLQEGAEKAVRVLSRLIRENQSYKEEYKGILVERYWELLEAER